MFNPLSKKTFRDLFDSWARALLVLSSIAVSTLTLGFILGSYDMLSRALAENFNIAKPSHISLNVDGISGSQLKVLQNLALIESLDTRGVVRGRVKTFNNTVPLVLFIVPNVDSMNVNKLKLVEGRWPKDRGKTFEILVERQAMNLLSQAIGGNIEFIDKQEHHYSLAISGTAYDGVQAQAQAQAQAEWEHIVYGYISPETALAMGIAISTIEVNIILGDALISTVDERKIPPEISMLLRSEGVRIRSSRININAEHPHVNVTNGMFAIQNAFAYALVLMSVILVFNLLSAQLAKQKKQISILKTLGARPSQISLIYFRSIAVLSLCALVIAIPSSIVLSKVYVDQLAPMLNIDIHSYAISTKTVLIQVGVGLILPLAAVAGPILRASRISIRSGFLEYAESMQENKASRKFTGFRRGERGASHIHSALNSVERPVIYALRNNFRNKGRSFTMTAVFCLAAVMFISSFNVSQSMLSTVDADTASKAWHFRMSFNSGHDQSIFNEDLSNQVLGSIIHLEGFNFEQAEFHGSQNAMQFGLTSIDPRSNMIIPQMIEGHWFSDETSLLGALKTVTPIVLNQSAIEELKNHKSGKRKNVGDPIDLTVQNRLKTFQIVGIVQTIGMPEAFRALMPGVPKNGLFIHIDDIKEGQVFEWENRLRQTAKKKGMAIKSIDDRWHATEILVGHFAILFTLMMMLSTIILFISANGIALNLVTSTLERTREIGVCKVMGATPRCIKSMLYVESAVLAIVAWLIGCILSIPFSTALVLELGNLLIKTPLRLSLDSKAYFISLPLMLSVAFFASIMPVNNIAKKPIRHALTYY